MTTAALSALGTCCSRMGQQEDAITYAEKALSTAKQMWRMIGDKPEILTGVAQECNAVGKVYVDARQVRKGMKFFEEAITLLTKSGEHKMLAIPYNNLAGCWALLGDLEKRDECLQKAIQYNKEQQKGHLNDRAMSMLYNNLQFATEAATNFANPAKAFPALQKQLDLALQSGERAMQAHIYSEMGRLCAQSDQQHMGAEYAQKSLVINLELGDTKNCMRDCCMIGNMLNEVGEEEEATKYLLKSHEFMVQSMGEGATEAYLKRCDELVPDGKHVEDLSPQQRAELMQLMHGVK